MRLNFPPLSRRSFSVHSRDQIWLDLINEPCPLEQSLISNELLRITHMPPNQLGKRIPFQNSVDQLHVPIWTLIECHCPEQFAPDSNSFTRTRRNDHLMTANGRFAAKATITRSALADSFSRALFEMIPTQLVGEVCQPAPDAQGDDVDHTQSPCVNAKTGSIPMLFLLIISMFQFGVRL